MAEKAGDNSKKGGPSAWVAGVLEGLENQGTVLDLACGSGRHTRAARALGFTVTAIDRNLTGISDLCGDVGVTQLAADLESGDPLPFTVRNFDVVIVTNYLWRPILPEIVASVAPAGVLVYETFAVGNEQFGRPSNPDFLLKPGELLEAVRPNLVAIAFEHATLAEPDRVVQRIVAVGPRHSWLRSPPRLSLHAQL